MLEELYDNAELAETLENHVQAVMDDIMGSLENGYNANSMFYDYENMPEKVETKHVSGFIPYTNGGFYKWGFVSCDIANQLHGIPEGLQQIAISEVNSNTLNAVQEFCKKYRFIPVPTNMANANKFLKEFIDESTNAEFIEAFYDIELEQYKEFEWGIQYGVLYNKHEQNELYFFLNVNIDAPYYRDNGHFRSSTGSRKKVDFVVWDMELPLELFLENEDSLLHNLFNEATNALFVPSKF